MKPRCSEFGWIVKPSSFTETTRSSGQQKFKFIWLKNIDFPQIILFLIIPFFFTKDLINMSRQSINCGDVKMFDFFTNAWFRIFILLYSEVSVWSYKHLAMLLFYKIKMEYNQLWLLKYLIFYCYLINFYQWSKTYLLNAYITF